MRTIDHGVDISSRTEVELSASTERLYNRDILVANTGASCHITNSDSEAVLSKDAGKKMRSL